MANKPRLSFWQIWNMSFGFLGIQFGFALQNANVSRIFETLGANIDEINIFPNPTNGIINIITRQGAEEPVAGKNVTL